MINIINKQTYSCLYQDNNPVSKRNITSLLSYIILHEVREFNIVLLIVEYCKHEIPECFVDNVNVQYIEKYENKHSVINNTHYMGDIYDIISPLTLATEFRTMIITTRTDTDLFYVTSNV